MNWNLLKKNFWPFFLGLIFVTLFAYTAIFLGGILRLIELLPSHLILAVSSIITMIFIGLATGYFIKENFWKKVFGFIILYSLYGLFVSFPIYFSAFGENSIYILGLLMIAGFIPSFLIGVLLMRLLHNKLPKISAVLTSILILLFLSSLVIYLADLEIIRYHHPIVTEIRIGY